MTTAIGAVAVRPAGVPAGPTETGRKLWGPLLSFVLPLAVAAGARWMELPAPWTLLCVLVVSMGLWIAGFLENYTASLTLVVGWIVAGIATPADALAGFATPEWAFALAVIGLSAATDKSGLMNRVGAGLLRWMPKNPRGQAAVLLLSGVVLTPLTPQNTVRVTVMLPFALALARAQGLVARGPSAALLGMAAWIGASPLMFLFLNGANANIFLLGLLPEESKVRFGWLEWLAAAAPLGLLVAAGSLAILFFLFREAGSAVKEAQPTSQAEPLRPATVQEKSMGAVVALTLLGWIAAPALGLDLAAIGLMGLLAAAALGHFDGATVRKMDWGFLIFFGVILGLARLTTGLGLDRIVADALSQHLAAVGSGPVAAVLFMALLCTGVQLVLPKGAAIVLLGLGLIPAAVGVGIEPWIVVITILATTNNWILPQQTASYLLAHSACEGQLFSHGQARKVAAAYTVLTLLALALCVPYWQMIGLL